VQQSFSYKLLAVPVPYMIFNLPATKKYMPKNGGRTFRMRRYNPLLTATVPLGNSGIEPAPQNLTAVDIDAQVQFYGTYILLNEQVTLQSQDPVLNQAAKRLGVSLRQSEDELTRDMLLSTASFINATGGANGDNPTNIARSDVDNVIETLADANAYTVSDMIEGADKFGTGPVRDAYIAMGSTQLIRSIEQVQGFLAKAQYPRDEGMRAEWGSVSNLRFLLSSIGSVSPSSSLLGADVYNMFITGLDAYTVIEQNGYSTQFIYRPPIYDGPLALNASVGYKFAQARAITNDTWVLNLRQTRAA
jgi:N4-gp56 family major capsid protein